MALVRDAHADLYSVAAGWVFIAVKRELAVAKGRKRKTCGLSMSSPATYFGGRRIT
jgi:hypothetical protein